jgi:hypothetical protein
MTTFQRVLPNLIPGEEYVVRARSINANGIASNWDDSISFTVPTTGTPTTMGEVQNISIVPGIRNLYIKFSANVENALEGYNIYVSNQSGFTADENTLVQEVGARTLTGVAQYYDTLTATPGLLDMESSRPGDDPPVIHTYYVIVRARSIYGDLSAPSAEVSGSPGQVDNNTIESMIIDKLLVGNLDVAMTLNAGQIQTGDSGARYVIDGNDFTAYRSDNSAWYQLSRTSESATYTATDGSTLTIDSDGVTGSDGAATPTNLFALDSTGLSFADGQIFIDPDGIISLRDSTLVGRIYIDASQAFPFMAFETQEAWDVGSAITQTATSFGTDETGTFTVQFPQLSGFNGTQYVGSVAYRAKGTDQTEYPHNKVSFNWVGDFGILDEPAGATPIYSTGLYWMRARNRDILGGSWVQFEVNGGKIVFGDVTANQWNMRSESAANQWVVGNDLSGTKLIVNTTAVAISDGRLVFNSIDPSSTIDYLDHNGTYYSFQSNGVEVARVADTGLEVVQFGNAGAPSFTWVTDDTTGMYRVAAGVIGFSTGGVERVSIDSTGLIIGTGDDGLGPVTGSLGSVQTIGTQGAGNYEGYSIHGRVVFAHDGANAWGIYNDVGTENEWMIFGTRNAGVDLRYNGTAHLATTSTGITITGLPIVQRANSELLRLQDTTSTNRSGFIGFHDSAGTDRVGYVGFAGNDDIYLYAEESAGNLFLGARAAVRVKVDNASMSPNVTEVFNLGSTTKEWNNIYTQNAVTVSDDRKKVRLPAKNKLGLDFLLDLQPFAGRRKSKPNGEIHQYLSAQEVRATLMEHGHDPVKSALWEEGLEEDGSIQALRQGELIPVLITAIKELHQRIAGFEGEIKLLESKLK